MRWRLIINVSPARPSVAEIGGSVKGTVLGLKRVDRGCEPSFMQAKVISEEPEQI